MSVLYCAIPYFIASLARREDPALAETPVVLIDPEGRVLGVSAEAAACGVERGMTARAAEVRCPEAHLLAADMARCRQASESLFEALEQASPTVEPHGWGAAYVDLGDLARGADDAISLCGEIGKMVRRELGQALQPALGWDSTKFTALAAACHTRPGHLRAVAAMRERDFLRPLPVTLLPLAVDALQRLHFLGLRTLGQYAALPSAAVWQQFGRAGRLAHRCARGEDNRPVVPRWKAVSRGAKAEFDSPLADRDRLVAALRDLASPLLSDLRECLLACGQIRLTVSFDDGGTHEKERAFLLPMSDEVRVLRAMQELLDTMSLPGECRRTGVVALSVALEQIQDMVPDQLTLFPLRDEREGKLAEVRRYLVTRFGANRLRRAALVRPDAPLPEWRVSWQSEEG